MHVCLEGDHINCVKTPAVGSKEGNHVQGYHLCVDGVSILEIVVPDILHGVAEELGSTALGCLAPGVVIQAGFCGPILHQRE